MADGKNEHQTRKPEPKNSAARSAEDEKLAAMVETLWEHRAELLRMATELPVLLRETGQQMHDAGTRAQTASGYLAGDVRELTGHAADMLESSKHQLLAVLHALERAGGALRNLPFIGDMGKMMGDQLGAIGEVANNLDQVGQKVRGLGDRLGDVGDDLHLMGASLLGSGKGLGAYGAPAKKAAPPKKAAAKKAAAKKAAAKKAAARKSPAKKATPAKKAAPAKKTPARKAPAKKAAPATGTARRTRATSRP
jgi:hypothetical protein